MDIRRALIVIGALPTLSACAPNWPTADWSAYVSKVKTLQFVAAASCNVPSPFNPVSADAGFFQVTHQAPVPNQPWAFDISYVTADGVLRDQFDVVQWWSLSGSRTPSEYRARKRCAVLVDLPRSKNADRPYDREDPQAKAVSYEVLRYAPLSLSLILVVALSLVFGLTRNGFEERRGDLPAIAKLSIAAVSVVGIALISLFAGVLYVWVPWREFQTTLAYYDFYNALPRASDGALLPISSAAMSFLIAGPPHPRSTQFDFETCVAISATLAAAWVIIMLPTIVRAVYWIVIPLPLEQAWRRALAERRTLTAEEILSATHKAIAGKRGWRLRIMTRKAQAFAESLGYVPTNTFDKGRL